MEERSIFAKVDKTKECDQMNESAVSGVFVRAVEEKGMDGMVDVRDGYISVPMSRGTFSQEIALTTLGL
jgi:hypothetical protein